MGASLVHLVFSVSYRKVFAVSFFAWILGKSQAWIRTRIDGMTTLCILDWGEHRKNWNRELLDLFADSPVVSVRHGISVPTTTDLRASSPSVSPAERRTLYVLSASREEDIYLQQSNPAANILSTGILRHDPLYVPQLHRLLDPPGENSSPFVLLISRPSNPHFYISAEQKAQYLKEFWDEIYLSYGMRLVVKLHPGERNDDEFRRVLGWKHRGSAWDISRQHPLLLIRSAAFVVTFYSGLAVDAAAHAVPVIERNNLRNLPGHTLNAKGELDVRSIYSRYGLVHSAQSALEFRKLTASCLDDADDMGRRLQESYRQTFHSPNGAIQMATTLLESLLQSHTH